MDLSETTGRPPIPEETRELVQQLARQNPRWGHRRGEQIIPWKAGGMRSVRELRLLAKSDPVSLELPVLVWSETRLSETRFMPRRSFYDTLRLVMPELELDIELGETSDWYGPYHYDVTVCSSNRPARPAGLSVLPPFAAVRYGSPEILIAPRCPANLRHPVVGWFAEHAATLNADYPALFAQFKRALAEIANPSYKGPEARQRQLDDAAELLNATLDRIRRSMPDPPRALSTQIYADESGRLLSRP